jgi:hypothetical protein
VLHTRCDNGDSARGTDYRPGLSQRSLSRPAGHLPSSSHKTCSGSFHQNESREKKVHALARPLNASLSAALSVASFASSALRSRKVEIKYDWHC